MGFQRNGAFAEKVSVPLQNLIPIHDIDLKLGAFIEPLAVAIHAVQQGDFIFQSAEHIVIMGGGTIGVLCSLVCQKQYPQKNITIVEISLEKQKLLQSLGFTVFSDLDFIQKIQEPYAFMECTGNAGVLESLFTIVPAPKGVQIVSVFSRTATLSLFSLIKYEVAVQSSQMYHHRDFINALDMMQDKHTSDKILLLIEPTIFELKDIQKAFEHMKMMKYYAKILVKINK